jgi:hypothetical protein
MNVQLTTRPIEQVVAAIQSLDLEPVKIRMMDHVRGEGWTREYADSIEVTYKNYLTMLAKYPEDAEDIALSEDTDEFWHTHILQTTKYAADCQAVFGNFLHHEPHLEEITPEYLEKKNASAEKTRQLYEREFGAGMDAAWSGTVISAENTASSGARIEATDAASSGARIQGAHAASSGARIQGANAASSGARIQGANAASSGARIQGANAASSGARIQGANAASSGARIRVGKVASSGARILPANDTMRTLMAA